ncbi:DUF421 domain-containing protein [Phytohabitans sp. ZYX-F-186]|uniref:DUF421 domain-containing protein n=1 Tax=Phytohabitans maris TaxID=3071409 RepID=A0ABU0ZKW5_9ACTN|nr:YetF domain-containing protein [Phytohabitans sp. ZYX-F-186]MDQ7907628.1 DUF421 domain-containing protein [Phytohabitans sp. ZYX-F-186]
MRLGLGWADAIAVVVAAVVSYAALLLLIRLTGRRLLARLSVPDHAAGVAVGAVMGRAILGHTPTLLAGVVGLATLFGLHCAAVYGRGRRLHRLVRTPPVLLVADGTVLPAQLRRAGISQDELRQRIRLAGVGCYRDVAAVVLETTGAISVLRHGATVAEDVFGDVRGKEHIRGLSTGEGQ